jgi:hypothetical protein
MVMWSAMIGNILTPILALAVRVCASEIVTGNVFRPVGLFDGTSWVNVKTSFPTGAKT